MDNPGIMEKKKEEELKNLKCMVYDRMAAVEQIQMEIRNLNQQIARLSGMPMQPPQNRVERRREEKKVKKEKKR